MCRFIMKHVMASELYSVFFFKQKTAYDMRISDWSSGVCSSDLGARLAIAAELGERIAVTVDRDIVLAIILQVAVAAQHQKGQPRVGVVAAAHHIADRGDLAGDIIMPDPFEVHQVVMHRAMRAEERRVGKECVSRCISRSRPS